MHNSGGHHSHYNLHQIIPLPTDLTKLKIKVDDACKALSNVAEDHDRVQSFHGQPGNIYENLNLRMPFVSQEAVGEW